MMSHEISNTVSRWSYLWHLAIKSAWNRRSTLLLIVVSVALSTTLLLSIEKIRTQLRESFVQAASGVDLVIGARGSGLQLVLTAIFHLGQTTSSLNQEQWEQIAANPHVAWTIPISLGDTHKGYPLCATTKAMFTHFHYRQGQTLQFAQGHAPKDDHSVVVGAEAAKNLAYTLGTKIVASHGSGKIPAYDHADSPLTVCGILAPTGTPVDRTFFINLAANERIHAHFGNHHAAHDEDAHHADHDGDAHHADSHHADHDHKITALLVGLVKRSQVFALERAINDDPNGTLMAVLPGLVMNEIWDMLNIGEHALLCISGMVTVVGLFGLAAAILAGLGERRRELAILRSSGASPLDILFLMLFEGLILVLSGILLGVFVLYVLEWCLFPILADSFGLFVPIALPTSGECFLMGCICVAGLCSSLIPALRAYRISLADGLTVSV